MPNIKKQKNLIIRLRNGDESCIEELMDYYFYIAEKYFSKYEGDIKEYAKKLALGILRKAIIDYAQQHIKYNMSHFIHAKFQCFDNLIIRYKNKTLSELESLAYQGNREARIEILNRNKKTIEKNVEKLYNCYLQKMTNDMIKNDDYSYLDENFIFPNNIFDYDDIIQKYYLYSWNYLNKYYNDKNNEEKNIYFNTKLCKRLEYYNEKNLKEFLNVKDNLIDLKDNYSWIDEIEAIELDEIKSAIENNLNEKFKTVFKLICSGYSYTEVANILGVTRCDTQRLKNKVLRIVKTMNIMGDD